MAVLACFGGITTYSRKWHSAGVVAESSLSPSPSGDNLPAGRGAKEN